MNEMKKINSRIRMKQIGRVVGGFASVISGMILLGKFMYQKGITDDQKATSEAFPEEYAAMTEKILQSFDK